MSAQPHNQDIKVYQTLNTVRQILRHDSVEAITKHLRKLIMKVPGEEILSGVLTRDSTLKDFSPYAHDGNLNFGFPIVIGLKKVRTFADAQENLPGIDFAFAVGADRYLRNTEANLDNDLFQDQRDRVGVAAPG